MSRIDREASVPGLMPGCEHEWVVVHQSNSRLDPVMVHQTSMGITFMFAYPLRKYRNSTTVHAVAVKNNEIAEKTFCGVTTGVLVDGWEEGEHLCSVCAVDHLRRKNVAEIRKRGRAGILDVNDIQGRNWAMLTWSAYVCDPGKRCRFPS